MQLGVFDHFGWAVAVAASDGHHVVDRRRIELVEPGVSQAPIHYDRGRLDVEGTAALVAEARASVVRATTASLDELDAELPEPVTSISLRTWPADFPTDMAVLVRPPWESRADAVMYRQVLAELAGARGWRVHLFDAKEVVGQATAVLGDRTAEVLDGPKARFGPPWTKEHRIALAATVVAGGSRGSPAGSAAAL
jgi:hypothetical protein